MSNISCSSLNCSKIESGDCKFLACGRCRKISYCSKQCQINDWKTHKKCCSNISSSIETTTTVERKDNIIPGVIKNRCQNSSCSLEPTEGTKTFLCSKCRSVNYCSKGCQTTDWHYHKQHCIPLEKQSGTILTNSIQRKFDKESNKWINKSIKELNTILCDYMKKIAEYKQNGDLKNKLKYIKYAIDLGSSSSLNFSESSEKNRFLMINLLLEIGFDLSQQFPASLAIEYLTKAIELSNFNFSNNYTFDIKNNNYLCLVTLANIYLSSCDLINAELYCIDAVKVGEELYGGVNLKNNELQYVRVFGIYSSIMERKGNYEEAINIANKSYNCCLNAHNKGDNSINMKMAVGSERSNLIQLCLNSKKLEKAKDIILKTLETFHEDEKNTINYANLNHHLGELYIKLNQLTFAEKFEKLAIQIYEKSYASDCNYYHFALLNCGMIRLSQKLIDLETENYLKRAISIALVVVVNVVECYLAMGDFYKARAEENIHLM